MKNTLLSGCHFFALFFLRKEKRVSLRLGHRSALTTIQVVIHSLAAATLQKKNCKCRLYPDRLLSCCFLASSKATRNRRWSCLCNPELRSAASRLTAGFDEKISRVRVQLWLDVDAPFCVVPPYIRSERDKLCAGSKTVCNEEFALTAVKRHACLLLLVL